MALFQPNRNLSDRDLRWFAGLWFPLFFGAIGLSLFRRQHPDLAVTLWSVTLVLAVAGLKAPRIIKPIYRGLIGVTFPIGWLLSHVLLAVMYFLVITPIGWLMRRSHDPMRRTLDRSASSYWMPCEPHDRDRYFKQT